jgi:hypothetical protein
MTLVELLVTMTIGMVVLLGVFAVTEMVQRHGARTAARVDANQRARPVMTRLMDELHSTCLGPNAGPILAGSTGTELIFLHGTGGGVGPTPDKRVVTFSGDTLSESVYTAVPGSVAPNWVFEPAPRQTRQLLTGVGPAGSDPVFRYFSYEDGAIDPIPLATPLSATEAQLTVQVKVAFTTAPTSPPEHDPNSELTLSDSALVRFSPASEDPTKVNGPCV